MRPFKYKSSSFRPEITSFSPLVQQSQINGRALYGRKNVKWGRFKLPDLSSNYVF
jgi:hypothetical protein